MTILERLNTLSDSLTVSTENFPFINMSCYFFMNQLPIEIAADYFKEQEVNENGVSCGTKYSTVIRGNIECRRIPAAQKRLATNNGSAHRASEHDPVFYKEDGLLFIIPEPTEEQKGYVSAIPNIFIPANAEASLANIPNVPENAYHIVILYAGHLILYKKARDKRGTVSDFIAEIAGVLTSFNTKKPSEAPSIADFVFTYSIPVHPAIEFNVAGHTVSVDDLKDIVDNLQVSLADLDLSFDTSDLDALDLNIDLSDDFTNIDLDLGDPPVLDIDFSADSPTLDLTGITAPSVDLSAATAAINKASNFIGGLTPSSGTYTATGVPTGAFWLDDEDPEMVQSAVQLANQEVNKGTALANSEISKLTAYQAQIDAKISEFRGKVEAFTSVNSMKVQEINAKLDLYRSTIDAKVSAIQARTTIINAKLTEIKTRLDKVMGKLQLELQARDSKNQTILAREQLTVQVFSERVQNYSARLGKVIQREQMKLQEWQTRVQQEVQKNQVLLQKFQNDLSSYSTKYQTELGKWSSNTEKDLKEFENQLNLALTDLQSIEPISGKFQMTSQTYVNLMEESQMLYQKYMNEFQIFVGAPIESN